MTPIDKAVDHLFRLVSGVVVDDDDLEADAARLLTRRALEGRAQSLHRL